MRQARMRVVAAETDAQETGQHNEVVDIGEYADLGGDPPDQRDLEKEDQEADEQQLGVPSRTTQVAHLSLPPLRVAHLLGERRMTYSSKPIRLLAPIN